MPKDRTEPPIKTGFRDDRNSYQNNTDFNSGSRDRASKRESEGMKALARPLKFRLPPQNPDNMNTVDKRQDRPFLPANMPHAHE